MGSGVKYSSFIVILLVLLLSGFGNALNSTYTPSSARDTATGAINVSIVNVSDGVYTNYTMPQGNYNENVFQEFNFSISITNATFSVPNLTVTTQEQNSGTTAKLEIYDASDGIWRNETIASTTSLHNSSFSLTYINTSADLANFSVRYLAYFSANNKVSSVDYVGVFIGSINYSAPTMTINSPQSNSSTTNRTVAINVTAQSSFFNYTNVSVKNSSGSIVNSTTRNGNGTFVVNITVASDGIYNITATGFDNQSQNGTATVSNITIDTTAPTIIQNSPTNNSLSPNTSLAFNWTASDALIDNITCNLTIDGIVNRTNISVTNGTSYATNATAPLYVAAHNWSVKCWDQLNNSNTSSTLSFTITGPPPSIQIDSPTQNFSTSNRTLSVNFTVNSTSGVNYTNVSITNSSGSIVNSTTQNGNGTFVVNLSVPSDGIYNITATAFDVQGLNTSATKSNITVDTTGPSIAQNSPTNGSSTSNASLAFNWTASDALRTNITCNLTIDGVVNRTNISVTNGTSYSTNATAALSAGFHNWSVKCWDDLNNTNNSQTLSFTVTGPPPSASQPSNQTVNLSASSTINWTINSSSLTNGTYYVERNGTLFYGSYTWQNNAAIIVPANNNFLGYWNYTLFYNDSVGVNGTPSTVFVNVTQAQISSTCSQAGVQNGSFTSANITIDGNFSDWAGVLSNPMNYMPDKTILQGDPDTPHISTSDRDLIGVATTSNSQYAYFYFKRTVRGNLQTSAIAYLDFGNDGVMNSNDKVAKFVWYGTTMSWDGDLYNYVPANPSGDAMGGDGYDMPGAITVNKSLEHNMLGVSSAGTELETRVSWSALGLSGATPLQIHFSTAKGSGTNLPSQIEDNTNGLGGTAPYIFFTPNRAKTVANGTSVYYSHDILNCGNSQATIQLYNTSSQGWNVSYYYSNGTQISAPFSLNTSGSLTISVKIDVPGNATYGTQDVTTIKASTSSANFTVNDTTTVSIISIVPKNTTISATSGATISVNYTVTNYQIFSDTINLSATSSNGWTLAFKYPNGTSITSLSNMLPQESRDIVLYIAVPNPTSTGTTDLVNVFANSSLTPSISDNATVSTTVKDRLTFVQNYTVSVDAGAEVYRLFNLTSNFNTADTINISYSSLSSWPVSFYSNDMVTPISSMPLDAYGGTGSFYAKVSVPANATLDSTENITIYANTSQAPLISSNEYLALELRGVQTYDTSGRTNIINTFYVVDTTNVTIYSRAKGLTGFGDVFFIWYDANGNATRQSGNITVSGGIADDEVNASTLTPVGTWTVIVYNSSDNSEISRREFSVLDAIAPLVVPSAPSNGSNISIQSSVEIACNVTDNVAVGSVYANITYPVGNSVVLNLTNSTPGQYYNASFQIPDVIATFNITCLAYDSSGNLNGTETSYFTSYDGVPPAIYLLSPANNTNTNQTAFNFTFLFNDTISSSANCSLYIDGVLNATNSSAANGTNSTFEVSGFSEGVHNWSMVCTDLSGNNGTAGPNYFAISATPDTIPPTVNLTSPANGTLTNSQNINFTFLAQDDRSLHTDCALLLDGSENQTSLPVANNTVGSVFVENISDGYHYWNVNCTDSGSNSALAASSWGFTIDTVPPNARLDLPANNSFFNSTNGIPLNFTANDSVQLNDSACYYQLDSNSTLIPLPSCANTTFNVSGDGSHNITLIVYDKAGNNATYGPVGFAVDLTAPNTLLVSPANASVVGTTVNFSFNATDQYSSSLSCSLFIDGSLNQTLLSVQNNTVTNISVNLSTGSHYWNVTCSDDAGNIGYSETWAFDVDTSAPIVTLSFPSSDAYLSYSNVTFSYSATDDTHASFNCSYYLDNVSAGSNSSVDNNTLTSFDANSISEGYHTWNVFCSDSLGNTGSASDNFTIDTTPPSASIDFPTNNSILNSNNVTFNFTANDSVQLNDSACYYQLDSDPTLIPLPSCQNTSFTTTDGTHNITLIVYDKAGNNATYGPVNFTVDTTPPSAHIDFPPNNSILNSTNVTFNFTANDTGGLNGSSCYYQLDSDPPVLLPSCQNTSFTTSDGTHNITLLVYDKAGNNATYGPVNFTIDTGAPNVSIILPANGTTYGYQNGIKLNFTALDALSGIDASSCKYYLDGNASNISGCLNTSFDTTEGNHTIGVFAKDLAGNGAFSENVSFQVSIAGPTVEILVPLNGSIFNTSSGIKLNFTASSSAPINSSSCYYQLDSGPHVNISSCHNTTFNASHGNHTIFVSAADTMGRRNDSQAVYFTVDTMPPTSSISSPLNGSFINFSSGIWLNFSADDNGTGINTSSCAYYIDGMGPVALPSCQNVTFDSSEGKHQLQLVVADNAGNTRTINIAFTIDLTAPTVSLILPANDSTIGEDVTFHFNQVDALSPSASCSLYVNGSIRGTNSSVHNNTETRILSSFANGDYEWYVQCYDLAGNSAQSDTWIYRIDGDIPAITLQSPPSDAYLKYPNVDFNFTIHDEDHPVVNCSFILDGVVNASDFNVTNGTQNSIPLNISEGPHNWSIVCTDSLTNVASESDNFTIDLTPPYANIDFPTNNSIFNSTEVTFNFTANDSLQLNDSACYYKLDSDPTLIPLPSCSNTSFTTTDGNHSITLIVYDKAGNNATYGPVNFSIDTIPPSSSIVAPQDNSYISNGTDVQFNFTASDSGSGLNSTSCSYSLDGGAPVALPDCQNITINLTEGKHKIDLFVQDAAGNSAPPTWVEFTVDLTPPTVALIFPENDSKILSSSPTLNFSSIDALSPTTNCTLHLDGSPNATNSSVPNGSSYFQAANLLRGLHNWSVSCADLAGNSGSSANYTLTVSNVFGDGGAIIVSNTSNITYVNATVGNQTDVDLQGYNGLLPVNITSGGSPFVEFEYNFTNSILNFSLITIGSGTDSQGRAYSSISGVNASNIVGGKTLYLFNANTSINSVCVLDEENVTYSAISENCTAANEHKVPCDGLSHSGYACTFTNSTTIKITGLIHSVAMQQFFPSITPPAPPVSPPSGGSSTGGGSKSIPILPTAPSTPSTQVPQTKPEPLPTAPGETQVPILPPTPAPSEPSKPAPAPSVPAQLPAQPTKPIVQLPEVPAGTKEAGGMSFTCCVSIALIVFLLLLLLLYKRRKKKKEDEEEEKKAKERRKS